MPKIKLAAVRVNAGLTQEQLGEQIGVSRATIASWENGETQISKGNLLLFATICQFPQEYIFLPYEFTK